MILTWYIPILHFVYILIIYICKLISIKTRRTHTTVNSTGAIRGPRSYVLSIWTYSFVEYFHTMYICIWFFFFTDYCPSVNWGGGWMLGPHPMNPPLDIRIQLNSQNNRYLKKKKITHTQRNTYFKNYPVWKWTGKTQNKS